MISLPQIQFFHMVQSRFFRWHDDPHAPNDLLKLLFLLASGAPLVKVRPFCVRVFTSPVCRNKTPKELKNKNGETLTLEATAALLVVVARSCRRYRAGPRPHHESVGG